MGTFVKLFERFLVFVYISGTVKLAGIISREGGIVSLQVIGGHPLLAGSGVNAMPGWIYRPTLLNQDRW
jgi:hypothetical protein